MIPRRELAIQKSNETGPVEADHQRVGKVCTAVRSGEDDYPARERLW